jgi:hypothetical protein
MKRYAVECDSPDGGRSTYAECWGRDGRRGRVKSEHDTLEEAVQACGGEPSEGPADLACTPWIWDRRTGRPVGKERLAKVRREAARGD